MRKTSKCFILLTNVRQYTKKDIPFFKLKSFPFHDHNICGMRTIFNFVIDAHLFLSDHDLMGTLHANQGDAESEKKSTDAAIAVHCKAGKGRTGVMIISFLIFSEHEFDDKDVPQNAINFYNARRTLNRKGLTIASQIRYCYYFNKFLEREVQKPYFQNALLKYNSIQGKFDSLSNVASVRLIPFSLTVGPF